MRVFSLIYHDVIPPGQLDASGFSGEHPAADPHGVYKLEREQFQTHLAAITGSVDHRGIERTRTVANLDGARTAALLHFDDGGSSAIETADMLEEAGWRGHFWITTDCIGTAGFVTTADVRALQSRGHVVGSHSSSHPLRMTALSDSELAREWGDSVGVLEAALGQRVQYASVPGGACDERVVRSAAHAGISVLFNSEPTSRPTQRGGCLVMGRYSVKRATPPEEAAAMAVGARVPRYAQWLTWNAKKAVKRLGGRHWLALRRRVLRR